mmetsp:Transcript_30629/g.63684  ORF Transcript_30629/g.63684 Transcript_30629/m.63684 type:complete len:94 (+) Transcript_30629:2561-2842(+)
MFGRWFWRMSRSESGTYINIAARSTIVDEATIRFPHICAHSSRLRLNTIICEILNPIMTYPFLVFSQRVLNKECSRTLTFSSEELDFQNILKI